MPRQQHAFGRREPHNWRHVERYPLSALAEEERPKAVPVVIGINWYSSFQKSKLSKHSDGTVWIRNISGAILGGHAVCIKPQKLSDPETWWRFYNQGSEGACVGFACSRMMSLLNRGKYDAPWLYYQAQKIDYWPGGSYPGWEQDGSYYEGTAIQSACDVLRRQGHKTPTMDDPGLGHGIKTNRWAQTVDEILQVLASPKFEKAGGVPILNSWGDWYPHVVWMPLDVLDTLLYQQGGEAVVVTDR
jgi:hypothetical protein